MTTLHINDKAFFDEAVFQTPTDLNTTEDYRKLIRNMGAALQRVYNCIDCNDPVDTADLNVLGDVINMLDHVVVDADHTAEAWTVSAGDFHEYNTEHLCEDEMDNLIDRACDIMQNDSMGEDFRVAIEYAAEEFGLKKRFGQRCVFYHFTHKPTGKEYKGTFICDEEHHTDDMEDGRKVYSDKILDEWLEFEVLFTEDDDAPTAYQVVEEEDPDGSVWATNHDEDIEELRMFIYHA